MGDGVEILKWTLTTVHSYWFKQTLQGEKVAFIVERERKKKHTDIAKIHKDAWNFYKVSVLSAPVSQRNTFICYYITWNYCFGVFFFVFLNYITHCKTYFKNWLIRRCIYCHSPVLEPPLCLKARVQHSFPGLTVYSNYQANKDPPCAVMGKRRGFGSWTRGFHFGKCVW